MTPRNTSGLHRFRVAPWLALAAFVLPSLLSTAAAADAPDKGPLVFRVDILDGKVSLQQAHDAVVRAAIGREWTIKEDHERRVVIYLLHRKNEATVTFEISKQGIDAYCVGFKVDKTGNRKEPELPTGWLNYLKRDITKALSEAAYLPAK